MPPKPWPFFAKVITKAFRNGYVKLRDRFITFGLALVAAGVSAFRGGGNTFTWSSFQWMPAAASLLFFLVLFGAFHFLRAQWEIYRDWATALEALNIENGSLRTRLQRRTEDAICRAWSLCADWWRCPGDLLSLQERKPQDTMLHTEWKAHFDSPTQVTNLSKHVAYGQERA